METTKLLNEARGPEKKAFKAVQGELDQNGDFVQKDSGIWFILDADEDIVDGVQDNSGLIDALNQSTIFENITAGTKDKIR